MTSPTLTVADVATRCALSEKAVRGAIARGELVAYKLAGRLRVDAADYQAWLDRCRVTPDDAPSPPEQTMRPLTSRGPLARLCGTDRGGTTT